MTATEPRTTTRERERIQARSLSFQFEMMAARARLELIKADAASVCKRLANEDRRAG